MTRLSLLALLALAPAARADDWPQWFGPNRDNIWREDGVLDAFPDGGFKVLWRQPVGNGYAGPAVANNRVYVADRVLANGVANPNNPFDAKAIPGSERVLCLDANTGKEIWKIEYPCEYKISYASGPRCTPTVDGDRVYALGAMGDLLCLNAETGARIWAKNFPKDYAAKVPVWGYAGHPLVDGDRLECVAGGPDGKLVVAFDKLTGKELWASQTCEGDFGYGPPTLFTFGGVKQLVVWHSRAVVALNPETGKRIWAVPFEVKFALTAPQPVQVGTDELFFTSFYNGSLMLKVSADKAATVWKSKAKGEKPNQTTDLSSIMPTPFISGQHLYGVCSYGELRCVDPVTGKRVWESMAATRGKLTPEKAAAMPGPDDGERWSNAFTTPHKNGQTFLFNEQGDLILAKLSPAGYQELGRTHVIEPTGTALRRKVVWSHPAYARQAAYVRNDKELVCVSLAK